MSAYHYHPDKLIYIRHILGDYVATEAEFLLDYGNPAVIPIDPYCEIYYDRNEITKRENRCNITPLNDLIAVADTEIEDIIDDYPNLMAAKAARENPILDLSEERIQKIFYLKDEGLQRMQERLPGILSYDQIQVMREQWLSITPAARTATIDFQYIIDVWIAGKNAISIINTLTPESTVSSYDVVNTPNWPV